MDIAVRTSGGRSQDVRVISSSRLPARNSIGIPPPMYFTLLGRTGDKPGWVLDGETNENRSVIAAVEQPGSGTVAPSSHLALGRLNARTARGAHRSERAPNAACRLVECEFLDRHSSQGPALACAAVLEVVMV